MHKVLSMLMFAVETSTFSNLANPVSMKITENIAVDIYLHAYKSIRNPEFIHGRFKEAYNDIDRTMDKEFNKFHYGMIRPPDSTIAAEIISRIVSAEGKKVRVLEIGCGPSKGFAYNVGSPWLSRCLSVAFSDSLEVHVSDYHDWVHPEIESRLFGMDVHQSSFQNLQSIEKRFDVIFCRNLPPGSFVYNAAPTIIENKLKKKGCLIIHEDRNEITMEGKRLSKSFSKNNLKKIAAAGVETPVVSFAKIEKQLSEAYY